jgi:hypothetical protein
MGGTNASQVLGAGTTITALGPFSASTGGGGGGSFSGGALVLQGSISGAIRHGTTTITISGTNNQSINVSSTDGGGTWTINKASGTVTLVSNSSISSSLTVSNGTLDLNGYNLTVSSTFIVKDTLIRKGNETITTGTFIANPSTSTMRFTDTTITVTINQHTSTFYNVKLLRGKTHKFTSGTTTTINGQLSYEGSSGNLLTMESTTPGNSYNINIAKHSIMNAVADIRDCNASSGVYIQAHGCTNSGNNTNVEFDANYTTKMKAILSPVI